MIGLFKDRLNELLEEVEARSRRGLQRFLRRGMALCSAGRVNGAKACPIEPVTFKLGRRLDYVLMFA